MRRNKVSHPFKVSFMLLLMGVAIFVYPVFFLPTALSQSTAESLDLQIAFTGSGSCASSNCHGSVWPRAGGEIQQNEYYIWASEKDRHSEAYQVLLEPRSQQMARHLGIDQPEASDRCLDCHAVNAPVDQRAKSFELSDGVGCESCHGPAAAWLGPHTTRNWTHQQSVELGMYDSQDLVVRMQLCLSCHLGNEKKTVDHELIAAGHPDLVFELDTFSALMPPHWEEEEAWEGVRRWGIGQAVALGESMRQLARRAAGETWNAWPEFADFDCFACHHNLVVPSSRQVRGYSGVAGLPPWNPSRYLIFRQLVNLVSTSQRVALDQQIDQLQIYLQRAGSEREQVADSANQVAAWSDQFLGEFRSLPLGEAFTLNLMRSIAGEASVVSSSGIRAAEQATMAIDALYNSHRDSTGRENPSLDRLISLLYESLQSTSRYDPAQFAEQLQGIQGALQ